MQTSARYQSSMVIGKWHCVPAKLIIDTSEQGRFTDFQGIINNGPNTS